MTVVYIPTSMREFTGGQASVNLSSGTITDLLQRLAEEYPGIHTRLYGSNGNLYSHIAVFVNAEDIRSLDNEATSVAERDEVHIIPAMAGG